MVLVIHGGFWRARYSLEHIGHLCDALTRKGFATWSIEYRRIGDRGGGWPGTFDDMLRALDHLSTLPPRFPLDLSQTVALGHSAGGHLALWLGAERPAALRAVISLAGVATLRHAWALGLSDGAVAELLGGTPDEVPERYAAASPIERLPLGVQQVLLHGTDDRLVPIEISRRYHDAALAAGDAARLLPLPRIGHFELIDPYSPAWPPLSGNAPAGLAGRRGLRRRSS